MLDSFKKLLSLLDAREKRRALLLFSVLLTVALFELLGVGSIMPFMAALTNPGLIESNSYVAAVYDYLGFESRTGFLIFLGSAFFVLLMASLAAKALGLWAQLRFTNMRNHVLSCRLVSGYLGQPYEWFLNRHSATLGTTVLSEINEVNTQALFPALQLVQNVLIALLLTALLLILDPLLALITAAVLGGIYSVLFIWARRYMERIGRQRMLANRARFRIVEEAFRGIKGVKIGGLESAYQARFQTHSQRLADARIGGQLFGELPSFFIQALLFGGMLLILLYLMAVHGTFQEALPRLTLYAFAGYRLMPALQTMHKSAAQLRATKPALDALYADLRILDPQLTATGELARASEATSKIHLARNVELKEVTFTYPKADRPALSDINLVIPRGEIVGFVGSTGSGKSTTADIILALLTPETGSIVLDGEPLQPEQTRAWQRSIGYVPQQIFLADDTIAANIAFGIPKQKIDMAAVEKAARAASLHDFVTGSLPEGYETEVGEEGVRLSGGQRQRIGIARALYRDPDVVILDEATSALDNLTEKAVIEAITQLGGEKTIIMIAHRLSTMKNADRIFMFSKGRVVAHGSYKQLAEEDESFRSLIAAQA